MSAARILVCDDEPGIRETLGQILGDEGYAVDTVGLGQDAVRRALGDAPPDAVLLDVWLPDVDGLAVLDRLRAGGFAGSVIMISGHGTVETAVGAVKRGADDFLEKPLALERVLLTLEKALERTRLARERDDLKRELANRDARAAEEEILLGESAAMSRLKSEIARAGASDARVLITGESGTGKELVARALHRASPRAAGPFVEVNGAAIPEELIESELFGHVKGSFTGAFEDRKGKWEQADGGTLFLDEIGDMSPRTQAKILRAIQDGKITRVGGTKTVATDVRIVAATNRDLPAMIRAGAFREDLYFRLAVVPLVVPPLAERPEDVPLLVTHFAESVARRRGRRAKTFEPAALGRARRAALARKRPRAPEPRRTRPPHDARSLRATRGPPARGGRAAPRLRIARRLGHLRRRCRSPRRGTRSRSATSRASSPRRRATCRAPPSASASTARRSTGR